MPKSVNSSGTKRRAKAAAAEPERGLVLRVLLHSPKDTLAASVAAAGVMTILINALFLQAGRHPSPMFGTTITLPKVTHTSSTAAAPQAAENTTLPPPAILPVPPTSSPLPRPRPAEAAARPGDPLGNLVRSTSVVATAPANIQRTPVPAAQQAPATTQSTSADPLAGLIVSSQRVASIQRALTDYGYGPVRATGTVGPDTLAAINRFERQHGMPISGVLSERLIRELSAATGRTFD